MTNDPGNLPAEWLRNEAKLQALADLPVGTTDPAARERAIDERQDRIEYAVGVEWMARRRAEGA